MTLENQLLITANLEKILKIYKTNLITEMHIKNAREISKRIESAKTGKQRGEFRQLLKDETKEYKEFIKRTEKYNSEFSKMLQKHNPGMDDFSEDLADFFNELVILLFDHASENPTLYKPALLRKDDAGNLFLDGGKYRIFTNK